MKAFVSWSGGKESALSLCRAKNNGMDVRYVLNMAEEKGEYSRSHGLSCRILRLQAKCMGIFLLQSHTSWQEYEKKFKEAVLLLKKRGVNTGVFGDIDLQEHREWVEGVCRQTGITPCLPLWGNRREDLLHDFIQVGFKAILVGVRSDLLDRTWLGREINEEFVEDLKSSGNIDLCGERGEYHTFVFDGPIFQRKVEFAIGRTINRNNYSFLEIEAG